MNLEFHNARPPQQAVESEQPWHRVLLYLKARGTSNVRCAKLVGKTKEYIGQISRQPWFLEKLAALQHELGAEGVKKIIADAAPAAALKVVELMEDSQDERIQRDCAFDLLDRYCGKAPITVAPDKRPPMSEEEEAAADRRIAELQRQLSAGRN